MTQENVCLNCNAPLAGKFCQVCGQKRIEEKERTFRYFCYQFFGATFFLENNIIKNLWFLLTRPGFLAADYLDGRRKRHMAPISLFLVINLLYFFSVGLSDLNLSLTEQIYQPQHGQVVKKIVEKRVASRGLTFEEYAATYNEQSTALSKTLIILHAPLLALLLALIYLKKKYFFTDHIIFALYLMAFVLLFGIVLFNLLLLLGKVRLIEVHTLYRISSYVSLAVYPLYFAFATKRFYRQSWVITLVKSVGIMAFFVLAHVIYRTLLFLCVFWTT